MNYDDIKALVLRTLMPPVMSAYTIAGAGIHYLVSSATGGKVGLMIIEPKCGFQMMSAYDWWEIESLPTFEPMADDVRAEILGRYGYTVGNGQLRLASTGRPVTNHHYWMFGVTKA